MSRLPVIVVILASVLAASACANVEEETGAERRAKIGPRATSNSWQGTQTVRMKPTRARRSQRPS